MGTNNALTENLSGTEACKGTPQRSKVVLHFYPSSLARAGNLTGKVFYSSCLFLVHCYWYCGFAFIFYFFDIVEVLIYLSLFVLFLLLSLNLTLATIY